MRVLYLFAISQWSHCLTMPKPAIKPARLKGNAQRPFTASTTSQKENCKKNVSNEYDPVSCTAASRDRGQGGKSTTLGADSTGPSQAGKRGAKRPQPENEKQKQVGKCKAARASVGGGTTMARTRCKPERWVLVRTTMPCRLRSVHPVTHIRNC